MPKARKQGDSTLDTAAEIVGRTLGQAAGAIDSFKAQHSDPAGEVREAVMAGQAALTDLASQARARSAVAVKKAKAAVKSTRRAAVRARRRGAKAIAKATLRTKKAGKRATTAVRRARKTMARRAARFKR